MTYIHHDGLPGGGLMHDCRECLEGVNRAGMLMLEASRHLTPKTKPTP